LSISLFYKAAHEHAKNFCKEEEEAVTGHLGFRAIWTFFLKIILLKQCTVSVHHKGPPAEHCIQNGRGGGAL
jgi:hypothetical protein